ncbi:MAG TPA: hypothetical protein VFH37_00075, partial [Candidatus Saccharimonadales bacterium]|nr:hypothetical protein [Candidatus Saccharimonadales bacterium]
PAITGAATLVSQSFAADSSLPAGSIVSLQKGYSDRVTAATTANNSDLFGVVVNPDSSQLSISSAQTNQVSVAQSGLEQVLVSDINGQISPGDSITGSPISGVGMVATQNSKTIGVAQDSFPNSTAQKTTYKDNKGQQHTVQLGQIPVLVSVAYFYKQPDKTIIPQALQNVANSLAGKKVSALPIIISAVIFIVTLVIVVSIVYSLIRSSIISVGRNPMSQSAVYRNVIQLSVLVIVILGVAVGSIYMVLTKF